MNSNSLLALHADNELLFITCQLKEAYEIIEHLIAQTPDAYCNAEDFLSERVIDR